MHDCSLSSIVLMARCCAFLSFPCYQREMALVGRGAKSRDVVVREILAEMYRVFQEVTRRANTLDQTIEQYFPLTGGPPIAPLAAGAAKGGGGGGGSGG